MKSEFENGSNPPSYEEVAKSTATIIHESAIGSGFFIAKNLLVTNHHVIESAENSGIFSRTRVGITEDGDVDVIDDSGDVVVTDTKNDLAIIRTSKSDYQALEMGNDEKLKVGDDIFIIGSLKGFAGTLSEGTISANHKDLWQITGCISLGSSGSPVFSKDLKVVGIVVSSISEKQNLNFVIPVSKLRDLILRNKVILERSETEEVVRQSENDFDKKLASYENKEDKTPQEMFDLGVTYYLEKKYQKAFLWFEKVANQGYTSGQFFFAVMYDRGDGVTKDCKKAFHWYRKAANQGRLAAQYNLALMYRKGKGVEMDYKKAFYWDQKAASQGLAPAQYNLALMYGMGYGVVKDYKKALYWFEKAANQGDIKAQYNLASMYHEGEGVTKNYKKSFYWFEKSANQGDVGAQFNLAMTYYEGKGVAKNHQKSSYWFEKAANQGDREAQFYLALIYDKGEGVVKDFKKAFGWSRKSTNEKLAEAQYNLALIYDKGEEATKEYKKDFYWYKEAANQGNAFAQKNLGAMYGTGKGVAENYIEAYKWLILAKAQSNEDDEDINEALDSLEKLMTSAQITEAQELANQFEAQGT